jgi:hypothetical protein
MLSTGEAAMQKEVSPGVLIGVAVVVVTVLGFFGYRVIKGEVSDAVSPMASKLMPVMARTNGDVSKMTPEEKKIYDEAVKSGYFRPYGSSGPMGPPRQANASGSSRSSDPNSGPSRSYPGSSGAR